MMQVVKQSEKQKLEMYMKCKKKDLAKMLIQANLYLENMRENLKPQYYPFNEQL